MAKTKVVVSSETLNNRFMALEKSFNAYNDSDNTLKMFLDIASGATGNISQDAITKIRQSLGEGKAASRANAWKDFMWIFARFANRFSRKADDQEMSDVQIVIARKMIDLILSDLNGDIIESEDSEDDSE